MSQRVSMRVLSAGSFACGRPSTTTVARASRLSPTKHLWTTSSHNNVVALCVTASAQKPTCGLFFGEPRLSSWLLSQRASLATETATATETDTQTETPKPMAKPPKKALSAYMIYTLDMREKSPDTKWNVKDLGAMWTELSEDDKKPYRDKGAEAKREHDAAIAAFETEVGMPIDEYRKKYRKNEKLLKKEEKKAKKLLASANKGKKKKKQKKKTEEDEEEEPSEELHVAEAQQAAEAEAAAEEEAPSLATSSTPSPKIRVTSPFKSRA